MSTLKIRNWDRWQSYRSDRGQPPWIKIHREVMRNIDWVALTDAQRGQLVAMWLLAADRNGVIPASPKLIQKLCFMDSEPDLNVFINHGFIEPDASMTSRRRQADETETETETETEKELSSEPDLFAAAFWPAYPRKEAKPKAASAFRRLNKTDQRAAIDGIAKWQRSGRWGDVRFIPLPATYINQRRWEDDIRSTSVIDLYGRGVV